MCLWGKRARNGIFIHLKYRPINYGSIQSLHNEQLAAPINSPLSVMVRSMTPFESKWLLAFPRVPVTTGTPLKQIIFLRCCPTNDCRRAAHSLFKIGRLFSLFSCFSLARLRLLILLLLLMSGNVNPNPGAVFPCSVCVGNVTWKGRSVQCCICSKWAHLRSSLLFLSRFKTPGSSYS